ncbi:uncharacterized protein LOC142352829 isoform X2 [Convolutriloba macropyga]|uniref:uncharacterized protein LOC142352829 isoform X2 n=1 Tax=Convolutriloba macropyga TaxID=536237 RepID=UPI003F5258CA
MKTVIIAAVLIVCFGAIVESRRKIRKRIDHTDGDVGTGMLKGPHYPGKQLELDSEMTFKGKVKGKQTKKFHVHNYHPKKNVDEEPLAVKEPEGEKEPQVKEPEVKEPEVKEPEVKEPDVKEPEVKEPKVKEPDVKEPEVKEPKVKEPKVKEPKVKEPKVKEPKVKEPEVKQPEDKKEPEVKQPEDKKEPEVKEPEVKQPEDKKEPEVKEPEKVISSQEGSEEATMGEVEPEIKEKKRNTFKRGRKLSFALRRRNKH